MVAVTFFAYFDSFQVPFQFDDVPNISENRSVHFKNFSFDEVHELIRQNYENSIRIFAYMTFAVNYYFGGDHVFGYHLVNLLIHLSSGLILYWFLLLTLNLPSLKEYYGPKAFSIAFFAAILFLSHPIQTQSVTYIVQRMASMGGMFYLLAIALYVKGRISLGKGRYLCWVGMACSYLLGLFTKENVAILPIFIALYEFYFFQNVELTPKGKKVLIYAFGAVVLIGLVGLVLWGKRYYDVILEGYQIRDFTLGERVLTQFRVVFHYVTLLVYPIPSRLNLDYDFPTSRGILDPWTTLVSILVVAGLMGYGIWAARKRPVISYFVLWYFGNLVIESSIFPLEMVYEHRLYLPLVGPVVLFVVGIVRGWEWLRNKWRIRNAREWPLWAFSCCLVLFFTVGSYERNLVWRDEIALWQDVVTKSPNKPRSLYNLGLAFAHFGRYEEAVGVLARAVSLKPDYVPAYNNLGIAFAELGKQDESMAMYQRALSLKPDHAESLYNLGRAYLIFHNRPVEAIALLSRAIAVKPDYIDAYINLGAAYNRAGRFDETVRLLEHMKGEIASRADGHFNLGVAYAALGNVGAAVRELETLRLNEPRMAQELTIFMRKSGVKGR
jgi:Flp pilus assembly protein TadD